MEEGKPTIVLLGSLALLALVFTVFGTLSIGGAVFSNRIAEAPEVIFVPEETSQLGGSAGVIPSGAEVIIGFQADRLDATAPRIVWSAATAAVYFGIALLITLLALGVQRSKKHPIFSNQMDSLVSLSYLAFVPLVLGIFTRGVSRGWVVRAFQGEDVAEFASTLETTRVLMPLLLIAGPIALASIWSQGRALQDLSDSTV